MDKDIVRLPTRQPNDVRRFAFALPALLALLPWLGGCGEEPVEPVGRLAAEPAELSLPHGTAADVTLRFEPSAELEGEGEPFVFVHLLDTEGEVVLTADHALGQPWTVGEPIDDTVRLYHSMLAPALPVGEYRLTAGLFRGDERWSLTAGEEVARQEYRVARVTVPQETHPMPEFSDAWMPVSPGTDRQVMARRWLVEEGTITLEIPEEGGSLAVEVQIPEPAAGQELVLEEGEVAPRVLLVARCTGQQVSFGGVGRHRALLTLERPAAGATVVSEDGAEPGEDGDSGVAPADAETRCVLVFRGNYQLVDTRTFSKALLLLEQLAWL